MTVGCSVQNANSFPTRRTPFSSYTPMRTASILTQPDAWSNENCTIVNRNCHNWRDQPSPSSENYPPAGWEPRQTGKTKSTTLPNHRQSSPHRAIHMLKEQYHVSPHNRIEAWKHAMDKCMSKWAQGRRDMIYSRHETTHNHQSGIIATQPESYPHTLILLSTNPLLLPTKPIKNQMRRTTSRNRPTLLFRQRKRHLTAASRIRHSGSFQRDAAPAR